MLIIGIQIERLGMIRKIRCWILMGKFSYVTNVRLYRL